MKDAEIDTRSTVGSGSFASAMGRSSSVDDAGGFQGARAPAAHVRDPERRGQSTASVARGGLGRVDMSLSQFRAFHAALAEHARQDGRPLWLFEGAAATMVLSARLRRLKDAT